jgi:hypothetical protein
VTTIFRVKHLFIIAGTALFLLDGTLSLALDPKFQLDINELRAKPAPSGKSGSEPGKGASTQPPSTRQSPAGSAEVAGKAGKGKVKGRSGKTVAARTEKGSATGRSAAAGRSSFRRKRGAYANSRARGKGAGCTVPLTGAEPAAGTMGTVGQSLRPRSRAEDIDQDHIVWNRLVPSAAEYSAPLQVSGDNFSLSLDPSKYPVFPAADGGRIIVDSEGSLSPLVKTILHEKEPLIRVVSDSPANRRRFYGSLLAAARFFSVQDDFSVDFGTDPKVTVTSDFKIEKSSDSLLNNDVILLNVSERRAGMPLPLISFLGREGFHVVDASPPSPLRPPAGKRLLVSISGSGQQKTVDSILTALSVPYESDREIELDDGRTSGVKLTVRADRYHEGNGRRIVFSFSEENPVQYTLLKLLELKGYRVVMLHPKDDFRSISEKLLSVLKLPLHYGMHHLWDPRESSFDVQLSGFSLMGGQSGGVTVLTNVGIDPLVRDLLDFKGYHVIEK